MKITHTKTGRSNKLKDRIRQDITTYNCELGGDPRTRAELGEDDSGGLYVNCNSKVTRISKQQNSTIIRVERGPDFDTLKQTDILEVAVDPKGELCFTHGDKFPLDVSEASETVLGPILFD